MNTDRKYICGGEHEAIYACELCCVESAFATMYSHILGTKHKESYLSMKYNKHNLSKLELQRESQVRSNSLLV